MDNQSFEEKLAKLQDLVSKLENEKMTLQESLKIYEEAMILSKSLNKELEEATQKVMLIQVNGEKEEF